MRFHNDISASSVDILTDLVTRYEYFSLDIFDTLITRLCDVPEDIFKFIEVKRQSCLQGYTFADRRVRAETLAREHALQRGEVEITLDAIYRELANDLPLPEETMERLKRTETDLELEFSAATAQGAVLINLLQEKQRRFILTSDMYLPRPVIEALLGKCGITGHEILLLSNEHGKTKRGGALYDDVISHFDCAPGNILHIGDNRHSDFSRARFSGLSAHHLPAAREAFRKQAAGEKIALFRGKSAFKNIFIANFINHHPEFASFRYSPSGDNREYWQAFGKVVVAPLMLSLVFWLKDRAAELEIGKIGFLARDGLFAKRCFDLVFPKADIQTDYLAASRRLLTVPNSVLSPTEIGNYYRGLIHPGATCAATLSRIPGAEALVPRMKGLGLDPDKVLTQEDLPLFYRILGENSGVMTHALRHEAEIVREYLQTRVPVSERYAVFDLGWRGSLQKAIDTILGRGNRDIVGFYFGTNDQALSTMRYKPNSHHSYSMHNGMPEYECCSCQEHTDVIEFIFSADHGSVTGLTRGHDGFEWVISAPSHAEREAQAVAAIFQKAALEAISEVLQTVPVATLQSLHQRVAIQNDFFDFLHNPGRYDARCFSPVRIFSSIGDSVGVKLIGDYPLWRLHRAERRSLWKAAFRAGMSRKTRLFYRCSRGVRRVILWFRDSTRRLRGR